MAAPTVLERINRGLSSALGGNAVVDVVVEAVGQQVYTGQKVSVVGSLVQLSNLQKRWQSTS